MKLTFHHRTSRVASGELWMSLHEILAVTTDPGERRHVGSLSYYVTPRRQNVLINHVEVREDSRRLGVATALLDELRARHEAVAVMPGNLTESGGAWWSKVAADDPYEITHHPVKSVAQRKQLQSELDPSDGTHEIFHSMLDDIHRKYYRPAAAVARTPDGKAVGMITYQQPRKVPKDDAVQIKDVRIHSQHQGKGVGNRLMQSVREQHSDRETRVYGAIQSARSWYEQNGGNFSHQFSSIAEYPPLRKQAAEDYWGGHRPGSPSDEEEQTAAPAHAVDKVFPDYYEKPHLYDHSAGLEGGAKMGRELTRTLRSIRGNPEADVTMYRALPKEHADKGFRTGDWVSLHPGYAAQHGMHESDPSKDMPVIKATVKAKHLWNNGDMVDEFGYHGPPVSHEGFAKHARFTPTKRVFTHTCGLDHRLWTSEGHLRPEIRRYIWRTMHAMWDGKYNGWEQWARVYFAGSEASEWTSETLEGNNDFDVLVGVNYNAFRKANPIYAHRSNQAITDEMNQGFRSQNGEVTLTVGGVPYGPFDRTTYVNPDSYDIRKIKPYAAYDVGADKWIVPPPHLPHWSLDDLPKAIVRALRSADAYAHSILKLPEPERTQQGAALFDAWHSDRSRAFGPSGQGWWDIANLREKWLDQEGIWAELVDCKHRMDAGLGVAKDGWSNEPRFIFHKLTGDPRVDHARILTTTQGPRHTRVAAHTQFDRKLLHDLVNHGGFTVHPGSQDSPETGFSASLHPDHGGVGAVHHISELTPDHLAAHRQAASAAFKANPDVHQGAWHDTETGHVYLDTSLIHHDEGHVRDFALHHRQLAYYDLGKGHSTYFDPTRDEDYHQGKPEAIQKYAEVAKKFGDVTPTAYHAYKHEYDPHPYAAEHEQAADRRATAARAATRIRTRYPLVGSG